MMQHCIGIRQRVERSRDAVAFRPLDGGVIEGAEFDSALRCRCATDREEDCRGSFSRLVEFVGFLVFQAHSLRITRINILPFCST